MEYTASCKNSFKWPVKDDILYYDTPQILALIQPPAPISNRFFRIKKQELEELSLQMSTWNEDSRYSFKQNIFNFPNFLDIIFLSMKYLKKKQSQIKILQNLRILPRQNSLVIDFFLSIKFWIKRILTTTEYSNLQ